jgi:DNA-binding NtrC family response regulator
MAKQGSHTCVLVVDDDVDVALAAKLTLGTERVRVETATSPATLRHLVPKLRPHVVLLDMNFATGAQDGREGLDCLRAIHELDPSVSVVLMTAYGDVALAVQALKQGATDFTLKPWQNEKLIATVHAAIDLSCARREAAERSGRKASSANRLLSEGRWSSCIGQPPPMPTFSFWEKAERARNSLRAQSIACRIAPVSRL